MHKIMTLMFLCLAVFNVSCGKGDNSVNSGADNHRDTNIQVKPTSSLSTSVNFVGVYDLLEMSGDGCGANIRIIADCGGYRLLSNHSGPEEFCHINRGDSSPEKRPPNPDLGPFNTDIGNPEMAVVTQEGNQLKSVMVIGARVAFTNTLTLNGNFLTKISNFKSHKSKCLFQKR